MRSAGSLLAAAAAAWLGGQILGEYPFHGFLPLVGGVMLGVAVIGAVGLGWRGEPPAWAVVVAVLLAVAGEATAVNHDTAGLRPWPWEGWTAVALAGASAGFRLVNRRAGAPPDGARGDSSPGDGGTAGRV